MPSEIQFYFNGTDPFEQTTSVAGTPAFQEFFNSIEFHSSTVPSKLMILSEVQSSNASLSIFSTVAGRVTLLRDVHLENKPHGMTVIELENSTEAPLPTGPALVRDLQPRNISALKIVTDSGILTLLSEVQSRNIEDPNLVIDSPNVTLLRL